MHTSHSMLGLLIVAWLTACTPEIQQIDTLELLDKRIGFLEDGRTTRQQVLLELGQPQGRYESDRIFVYVLDTPTDTTGTKIKQYHLVTVFGEGDVVREHSVVVSR